MFHDRRLSVGWGRMGLWSYTFCWGIAVAGGIAVYVKEAFIFMVFGSEGARC